jgi:hypothetical protein
MARKRAVVKRATRKTSASAPFVQREFRQQFVRQARTFEDYELDRCTLDHVETRPRRDPAKTVVLRRIRARRLLGRFCEIQHALLDEVEVEGLKIVSGLFVRGCIFRHVTLRGRIEGDIDVRLRPFFYPDPDLSPQDAQRWDAHAARFYESVDWAVDLSQADLSHSLSLPGVPSRLVRRDPRRSAVVNGDRARARDRSRRSPWDGWLAAFDDAPLADMVLFAGKKREAEDMAGLDELRELGIADRD